MKLALVGAGNWGKNLVRDFYSHGVLHSICELNDAINNENILLYPDLLITKLWSDILSNPIITAVCVSLPPNLHYSHVKDALLANKDVFVEKPITLDLNQALELELLAKSNNKILMVGHILHYHPAIQKIKNIILSKELGKIIHIVSNRFNLGVFRVQENVLWSFAPHDISVILSLCHLDNNNNSMPLWVHCNGNDSITKNVHDVTNSVLKFNDVYVNINVNWLSPYKEQKLTIVFEKGMIVFDDVQKFDKLKIYSNYLVVDPNLPPSSLIPSNYVVPLDLSNSPLFNECSHFIDCCANRSIPITDSSEGIRVLTILDKLSLSLSSGNKVFISPSPSVPFSENVPSFVPEILIIPTKNYYSHQTSTIDDGAIIGDHTKIWHYSHVSKGAVIGGSCTIGQNCFIADNSKLGNFCKVQNNVSLYSGVHVEDYVFIGPSCVFTNDKNPRAKFPKNGDYIPTTIHYGSTIGANCTILCGIVIGTGAFIGAGSVVTKNVDPYSLVVGNPAKQIGYVDEYGNISKFTD